MPDNLAEKSSAKGIPMTEQEPYNPLAKKNLAESVVRALLNQAPKSLSRTEDLSGAGIYIIYYSGDSALYKPVAAKNRGNKYGQPIYIGKASPKGGRKGIFADDQRSAHGKALHERLGQHHTSIDEAENLEVSDFSFRALVVDEIFIPLGENMLIEHYRPVWNLVIDGFGNKDPGRRRKDQYQSAWDVIHPGRKFAEKLGENPIASEEYIASLRKFYTSGKVVKPKKPAHAKGAMQMDEG